MAARYGFLDYGRKLANAVVFARLSHVESRIVDRALRGLEYAQHGRDNVANVHDRAPGRTVTLDMNTASGVSRRNKIVQH